MGSNTQTELRKTKVYELEQRAVLINELNTLKLYKKAFFKSSVLIKKSDKKY